MAKEYIEREAAKRELLLWAVCINHPEYLMKDDALHVIDSIPAADVVEVEQESNPLNGWISVQDRLPEMGEHYQSEDVLVCIDYRPDDPDTTKDSYMSIDHVDFNCFGQGWFSCERDDPRGGEPSPYFVTHWMPMPNPPKGE